jgi:MSHA biogenesis protein MshP
MKQPFHTIATKRRKSAGIGIVTAIFLLVVLAGLGVALVTIFTSQQQSMLLDEQGVRAQQAARAGIEWGLFRHLQGGGCVPDTDHAVALRGEVLKDFTVSVRCTMVKGPEVPDGEPKLDRWIIRATACAPALDGACPPKGSSNPDYVRRDMEVQV